MMYVHQSVEHSPVAAAVTAVENAQPRDNLSGDEENRLALLIARGDKQARNLLIQSNLRLVYKVAQQFLGRGLPLDDLIGEGNLGLIKAAQQFDPKFGSRFGTYARFLIKEAIHSALINTSTTIRVPSHMVKLLIKWRRAEHAYYQQTGHLPTIAEVAVMLNLTRSQTEMLLKARHATQFKLEDNASLEALCWSYDNRILRQETPSMAIEADEEWNRLLAKLPRLTAREYKILCLRFGLEGGPAHTLQQVAQRMGLNKERIRQVMLQAIEKLEDNSRCSSRSTRNRTHRGPQSNYHFDQRCHPFRPPGTDSRDTDNSGRRHRAQTKASRLSPRNGSKRRCKPEIDALLTPTNPQASDPETN